MQCTLSKVVGKNLLFAKYKQSYVGLGENSNVLNPNVTGVPDVPQTKAPLLAWSVAPVIYIPSGPVDVEKNQGSLLTCTSIHVQIQVYLFAQTTLYMVHKHISE